jgi:hypothetical protein
MRATNNAPIFFIVTLVLCMLDKILDEVTAHGSQVIRVSSGSCLIVLVPPVAPRLYHRAYAKVTNHDHSIK